MRFVLDGIAPAARRVAGDELRQDAVMGGAAVSAATWVLRATGPLR